MTALWIGLIGASLICFVQKLLGYLVPPTVVEGPRVSRATALLPVALLAALVATQSVTSGQTLVLDARVIALAVAALLLWRKAPFLLVVVVAAGVAAGLRAVGLP